MRCVTSPEVHHITLLRQVATHGGVGPLYTTDGSLLPAARIARRTSTRESSTKPMTKNAIRGTWHGKGAGGLPDDGAQSGGGLRADLVDREVPRFLARRHQLLARRHQLAEQRPGQRVGAPSTSPRPTATAMA
jgi:hypothetical protein